MLVIGNEELDHAPPLGSTIHCPHCGEDHEVLRSKRAEPGREEEDGSLQYYNCGGKAYLCGINFKAIGPKT